mmetsp:Transcript_14710/g.44125  ORF Transcript_14710/g.44125 Transcript_14710/m.44125 type:complete len:249 (+) Transcript_14710:215-961(+)
MRAAIGSKKGWTTKEMKPICPSGTVMQPSARSQSGETSRPSRTSSSPCLQNSWRTLRVQDIMTSRGLQGLEMSAAWTTVSRRKSLRSSAFCVSAVSGSCAKPFSSCTCVPCFAMSVASTMAMRPLRVYCWSWKSAAPAGASEVASKAFAGTTRASLLNQSLSGELCMVSNARLTCICSRMALSLYRTAKGDIVLVWKRLFLPGCPTSWIKLATRLMKWSSWVVRAFMYCDCISHSVVAVTSAAWAALW